MFKYIRKTITIVTLFCMLSGIIAVWPVQYDGRVVAAFPGASSDGGLILLDEMADFTQAYSHNQVSLGTVTAATYTDFENDITYWTSSGSQPDVVYKKKDIRSMQLIVYADPLAGLPALQISQSINGSAFTSVATDVVDEGTMNGSWQRIVYSAYGLSSADYLRISWEGSPGVALSKLRIGYTGGVAFEDTGFESSDSTDLTQSGGWETRIAKSSTADTPDFNLSVESAQGAPGQYFRVTENQASSSGIVLLGQRVTLPSFFTDPLDLVSMLDYQAYSSSATPDNKLKLVVLSESAWDTMSTTNIGAGVYNASAELFSLVQHDDSSDPSNVNEWTGLMSSGTSITTSLAAYTGDTVVIAMYFETNSVLQSSVLKIDNFELNTGELSNSRPHFIQVKEVRDKLFAYRWAHDVLEAYQSKYDVWLSRDVTLLPDSTYIWENRYTDPELDVALIFEYKSYNDIVAMGYDYDTYYQVAEFKSPGIDPVSTEDDTIISLQNTSSEDMQRITKGWYARWTQYHSEAAQYLSYLYVLTGNHSYAAKAAEIVKEFAAKYPFYVFHDVVSPVRDFATRAFYQPLNEGQYLITPLTYALDNIYNSGELSVGEKADIRNNLLYPATDAVKRSASMSNFQVIQNTSIGLVGYFYDDPILIDQAKSGYFATAQSIEALGSFNELLDFGVGEDGFWFEGTPSYHGFVLKFFIYLANAAQRPGSNKGEDLYTNNLKFKSMFDAILNMPYPDLTLQANNDSVYKPSLLTPIYLWMIETADQHYGAQEDKYKQFLNQAYQQTSRSAADMYSLLFGHGKFPSSSGNLQLKDVNMSGMGSIYTRSFANGQTYMTTLDYGPYTGTHDHYDKLAITTYGNGRVWLDDLGLSPYGTESAENYYHYSVAHNTVSIPGRSQPGLGGSFLTLGHTQSMHASAAAADGIFPDVQQYRRGLISVDDWMLDIFSLKTTRSVPFDWMAHVPNSTLDVDIPTTPTSGALGTQFGYQYIDLDAVGSVNGNWNATFTDGQNPALNYNISMLNSVTTDVYVANSFGTGNQPNIRIPVLAARKSIDGEGEFIALHRYSPSSDGIATVTKTNEGVNLTLQDGSELNLQYDISHAKEEASFKLLKRKTTSNQMLSLELVNDNRMTVGNTVYASSDQILSSLSIVRQANQTFDVNNDPDDTTPRMMANLTFYVGGDAVDTVNVDGSSTPFIRNGNYISITAPLKAAPTIRNNQVNLNASEDTYAKESEPTRSFGIYSTIGVRNGGTSASNMAAYLKFDMATYTGMDVSEAKLRFYAYDSSAPYNPVLLNIYGIVNNSWSEETLNWTNAPNLGKSGGYANITGLGTTAFSLGTVSMENHNQTFQELDVSEFVRTYGLENQKVSFIIFPQNGYNDWINISSKESGIRGPQLVVKESGQQIAAASGYVRGGAYATQNMNGTAVMEIMDAPSADDDRIAYLKFDLAAYSTSELGKGVLSFHVNQVEPGHVVPISIYGLTDSSWTESNLTWTQSTNHSGSDTNITGVPTSAVKVATVYVDSARTYSVDATAYLQSRLPSDVATFLLVDETDEGALVSLSGRVSNAAPHLLLYKPFIQTINQAAYTWGGSHAGDNHADSTHLVIKNVAGANNDRKTYLQIDLSQIKTERVNRASINLYGSNTASSAWTPVTVYGITDNNWSESTVTFNQSPNHDPITGNVTGIGSTAFALDTTSVGPVVDTYSWDVSEFIHGALRNGDKASLVLVIDSELFDSYLDFNSDDGVKKPTFYLEY